MMSLGTPRHRRPSRNRTSKSSVHGSAAGHDWVRPDAGQGGGGCEARRKPCPFLVLAHVRVWVCVSVGRYVCVWLCTGVGTSTIRLEVG